MASKRTVTFLAAAALALGVGAYAIGTSGLYAENTRSVQPANTCRAAGETAAMTGASCGHSAQTAAAVCPYTGIRATAGTVCPESAGAARTTAAAVCPEGRVCPEGGTCPGAVHTAAMASASPAEHTTVAASGSVHGVQNQNVLQNGKTLAKKLPVRVAANDAR